MFDPNRRCDAISMLSTGPSRTRGLVFELLGQLFGGFFSGMHVPIIIFSEAEGVTNEVLGTNVGTDSPLRTS